MTQLALDDGQYSPVEGAVFNLRNFSATMVARGKAMPLCFARMTQVHQGVVFISSESLVRLFQSKIQDSKSQISDIKIEIDDKAVHLSGKMHKRLEVSFEIEGPVSTDGTALLLQAKHDELPQLRRPRRLAAPQPQRLPTTNQNVVWLFPYCLFEAATW